MMKRFLFLTAALALLTASCGAAVNPRDTLTTAMANVRAAETAGAKDNPKAELYLKRATDQIAEAKKKLADAEAAYDKVVELSTNKRAAIAALGAFGQRYRKKAVVQRARKLMAASK